MQSWHLTVQRELRKDLVLDVAYVGNRSNGLMILGDYNQARPNNPGENLTVDQRRPIPGFQFVQISYGGGFATYHGLQAKIEKRYAAGVYLLNSFTWSKAIDNASGHLEAFNGDNSRVNFRNLPSEKALGAYDQPFNNTTSVVWELPYGKGRKWGSKLPGVVDAILGGWRMTGINTMTSGQPMNISYFPASAAQTNTVTTYRPNYVGGDIYPTTKTATAWLNKAAFGIPDPTQPFGNAGRNIARTEPIYNFDLGCTRSSPSGRASTCSSGPSSSTCSTPPTSGAGAEREQRELRADHQPVEPARQSSSR